MHDRAGKRTRTSDAFTSNVFERAPGKRTRTETLKGGTVGRVRTLASVPDDRLGGAGTNADQLPVIPPPPPDPVLLTSCTAPPAQVIDLTNPATIVGEMGKTNARYIHIVVGGTDYWLDFGQPPQGVDAALQQLTAGLVVDGQVRCDPTTYFRLDGTDVVAGIPGNMTYFGSTETTENVLDKSLEFAKGTGGDDLDDKRRRLWNVVNGDSETLDPPEGQDKPGAWYNAIVIENGVPRIHRSDKDKRGDEDKDEDLTIDLTELRDMVKREFDFSGAITTFEDLGKKQNRTGEEIFVEAVVTQHSEDAAHYRVIAKQVWSYATTGADTNGVTDIQQLQGYVYVLDPQIQKSSDSNTDMTGNGTFNPVPGDKKFELAKGDGKYGRATILMIRHLMANVKFDELRRIATQQLQFTDGDRFVYDDSGSMTGLLPGSTSPIPPTAALYIIFQAVDQALQLGAFDPLGTKPSARTKVDGKFDDKRRYVTQSNQNTTGGDVKWNFEQALKDAYAKLYGATPDVNAATQFLALFEVGGAPLSQFFDVLGGVYQLKADELMKAMGDEHAVAGNPRGAMGESSLKSLLITLLYSKEYSIGSGGGKNPDPNVRLNAIADEGEQGLEYLELVKALSAHMGVPCRIIAAPTHATTINPATDLVIVNVQDMNVVRLGSGAYVVEYIPIVNGVVQPLQTAPLPTTTGAPLFDRTWIPLTNNQTIENGTE